MIKNISKFIFLFVLIIIFLSFKNQTKILNSNILDLKREYNTEFQLYLKRNIQLTKMINQFQSDDIQNKYVEKDIIKFNRSVLNKFTLIKVNYDKSE